MLEIGASLREARERRKLGYAEVEAATLIPVRYLQALEQEEFERLPEGLYRRSFLREYADYLGLDSDVLVREYELRTTLAPEPTVSQSQRRLLPIRHLARALPTARSVMIAAATALVGIAVWWLSGSGGGGGKSGAPETPRTTPSTAAPRSRTHPSTTTTSAPHRRPPPVLTLSATTGACWLSVHLNSGSGRVVYERTLRQGQTVRFGLRTPLLIRFGAPGNLTATIGQRSVTASLPSGTSDVVASAAGLRPAG